MSLDKNKSWRKIAVNDEHLPDPDRKTERAALAYNSYNNIYLIVTDSKCTAAKFRCREGTRIRDLNQRDIP
ncbi:MAG: hypothetical protein ACOYIB_08420 [Desulfosporosinus sp.]|jgi:hypothetical protein